MGFIVASPVDVWICVPVQDVFHQLVCFGVSLSSSGWFRGRSALLFGPRFPSCLIFASFRSSCTLPIVSRVWFRCCRCFGLFLTWCVVPFCFSVSCGVASNSAGVGVLRRAPHHPIHACSSTATVQPRMSTVDPCGWLRNATRCVEIDVERDTPSRRPSLRFSLPLQPHHHSTTLPLSPPLSLWEAHSLGPSAPQVRSPGVGHGRSR